MTPLLENAKLSTDLDANHFMLLNVGSIVPVPVNLVASTDPRLTDARVPINGSVTNASVSNSAAIVQSKLSLNGKIPTAWLGTTSATAAKGSDAEYLANKGQPNGYAALDGTGKIPAAQVPTAVGTGTVTSVALTMPAEFSVSGSPITGAGTLAVTWATVADHSWFGNKSGGLAAPQFYTTALPTSLIPNLDAAKVTSGTFAAARLPLAVGLGVGHAPGAVPDPGDGTGGALATDYLARDMTWQPVPSLGPSYQPTITSPTINHSAEVTGPQTITVSTITGASVFYSLTSAATGFLEFPVSGYYSLPAGDDIWVYSAKTGYNDSAVVTYNNPNPP